MKQLCIYHSRDLDGWCSAAIVNHYWSKNGIDGYMIGWDYGDKIPEEEIRGTQGVIMCDVSFPRDEMIWIMNTTDNNLVWIDHHVSSINELTEISPKGIRNTKLAACELTWLYFFPGENMPEFVRLLGMYDSFRHKGSEEEKKVVEFQYGARVTWTCPGDFATWFHDWSWKPRGHLEKQTLESIHRKGITIYEYLKLEAKNIYEKAYPTKILGYNFLTVNKERFNPKNFDIHCEDEYDGFACFWYDGKNKVWNWSLYSDKIDVSKIASALGGGGHSGAAGFQQERFANFR